MLLGVIVVLASLATSPFVQLTGPSRRLRRMLRLWCLLLMAMTVLILVLNLYHELRVGSAPLQSVSSLWMRCPPALFPVSYRLSVCVIVTLMAPPPLSQVLFLLCLYSEQVLRLFSLLLLLLLLLLLRRRCVHYPVRPLLGCWWEVTPGMPRWTR